ncbi:MAG: beta-N-acetylhexosaminidase, partial [Bacteroidetes bacterium]
MRQSIQTILLIISLSFIFLSCSQQHSKHSEINIIPKPLNFEKGSGNFILNAETKIVYPDDSSVKQVAEFFNSQIAVPTGFKLQKGNEHESTNVIVFKINDKETLGEEGYELIVNKESIVIIAKKSNGFFYGMQTLFQLLPPEIYSSEKVASEIQYEIPSCRITDKPRFAWRGMHLDVSRHFFPKEFIKRYIDLIAMHKMNVFHWHLTDDNGWLIEIKKYPLLTEISAWRVNREDLPWRKATAPPKPGEKADIGGFYTQDDIREIVQYAAARQIEIIPEIEMPGHTSEVFAAYPELSCTGEKLYVQPGSYWPNSDIFCGGNEEVFTFIENVLDEVAELFPSKYIHIGGDEADKTEWRKCAKCQKRIKDEGLEDENELQSWFIKRIEKYLISKNKQLIGWDEILEGGLAPEATVMSWRGVNGGIEAAQQGHDVVMSPGTHCYLDHYQADPDFEPKAIGGFTTLKKVYSFDPVPGELNAEQAKHILGGQGNVWTEYISTPEHAEYMAVPRMAALAEVLWTPKKDLDWDNFRHRINKQYQRFDIMDVNYSKGSWKVDIQPAQQKSGFSVVLESEQLNPIHYTLDGS